MDRAFVLGVLVALTSCTTGSPRSAGMAAEAERPARIGPGDVAWTDVANSPGEQFAVLAGDPDQPGEYTLRRKFPAGHQTRPHWHPHAEYGTVLSGVLYIGFGEQANRVEAAAVPAGGFIRLPPYTAHYTYADGPVVLQVHGPGPRQTYYVHEHAIPRR